MNNVGAKAELTADSFFYEIWGENAAGTYKYSVNLKNKLI